MSIIIQLQNSRDQYAKRGSFGKISITGLHNHSTSNAEALSLLPSPDSLRSVFEGYFFDGQGISEAARFHVEKMELADCTEADLADATKNPKYRTVKHWHTQWLAQHQGPRTGDGMIDAYIMHASRSPKEHQGSGNIIMFSQFLFITIEGFIFTMKLGQRPAAIPLPCYVKMAAMYSINVFFQTVLLHCQVGIPLQQLLRTGSLIANLILGVVMLNKRYKASKYTSIVMISLGIGLATLASANNRSSKQNLEMITFSAHWLANWVIGAVLFVFALLVSASLGIYQEIIFATYGKHATEALYFNHLLPLPIFLFFIRDLFHHAQLFTESDSLQFPFAGFSLPKMWAYLFGNVISQYVCIASVFVLTAECTSLTVTLVATLRKFVSLLFSIVYFKNSFTAYHWIGTVLVFGGTLLFADILSIRRKQSPNSHDKEQ